MSPLTWWKPPAEGTLLAAETPPAAGTPPEDVIETSSTERTLPSHNKTNIKGRKGIISIIKLNSKSIIQNGQNIISMTFKDRFKGCVPKFWKGVYYKGI